VVCLGDPSRNGQPNAVPVSRREESAGQPVEKRATGLLAGNAGPWSITRIWIWAASLVDVRSRPSRLHRGAARRFAGREAQPGARSRPTKRDLLGSSLVDGHPSLGSPTAFTPDAVPFTTPRVVRDTDRRDERIAAGVARARISMLSRAGSGAASLATMESASR